MDIKDAYLRVRELVASLSPRRRRWERFLRELPIDPNRFPESLPAPGKHDFIICGTPRTGTTLLAAMLFQPPEVVVASEPWDGMRMLPAELFQSLREEIRATGKLARGRLQIEALQASGTVQWCLEGESRPVLSDLPEEFLLGVKWPGFWEYLGRFPETKFLVCTRHPIATVNSFKKNGGRIARGLQYKTKFNQTLNRELSAATSSFQERRVLLYDYCHRQILPHVEKPNVFVVHYERWYSEPRKLMQEIADFLGVPLQAMPASIRPESRDTVLSEDEVRLVKELCETAPQLGYSLD